MQRNFTATGKGRIFEQLNILIGVLQVVLSFISSH
jgi:hypothetical protein